jgi:hypothetical protein
MHLSCISHLFLILSEQLVAIDVMTRYDILWDIQVVQLSLYYIMMEVGELTQL